MSWSQARSQTDSGWQHQQAQTLPYHFHVLPLIEALADAVERGARDQQVDELVNELASRFQKGEQVLYGIGTPSSDKDIATQKKSLEEHRNKLEERRALLAKYKTMLEGIYSATSPN